MTPLHAGALDRGGANEGEFGLALVNGIGADFVVFATGDVNKSLRRYDGRRRGAEGENEGEDSRAGHVLDNNR